VSCDYNCAIILIFAVLDLLLLIKNWQVFANNICCFIAKILIHMPSLTDQVIN